MVTVTVIRRGGHIAGYTSKGHAGMGEHGSDIVCAAISALLQTALIALTDRAGIAAQHTVKPGDMRVMMPEGVGEVERREADTILETMLLGLRSIEPGGGLIIVEQEV